MMIVATVSIVCQAKIGQENAANRTLVRYSPDPRASIMVEVTGTVA